MRRYATLRNSLLPYWDPGYGPGPSIIHSTMQGGWFRRLSTGSGSYRAVIVTDCRRERTLNRRGHLDKGSDAWSLMIGVRRTMRVIDPASVAAIIDGAEQYAVRDSLELASLDPAVRRRRLALVTFRRLRAREPQPIPRERN